MSAPAAIAPVKEKEAIAPIGQGIILTRLELRKALRQATDPGQQKAITAALADSDFASNLTTEGLQATGGVQAGASPFAGLLQWLIANLPQILALIMALFGGA